jgi:allantoinase
LFTELPMLKRPTAARSAGFDGVESDLVAFDPDETYVVEAARLLHRHPVTPYAGRNLTGRVRQTWLRGTALLDPDRGVADDEPVGRLLNRG